MKKATLTIVGVGIKFLSQLTLEAKSHIEKADKVLYLVNNPATKQWISKSAKNSESLENLYFDYALRDDAYTKITQHILTQLNEPQHVCIVLYGHPTVFAKPALDAAKIAIELGYNAKILPGISAEACLYADLLIDPSTYGVQSFDATDFLLYRRNFDPNSHLILWQADVIGERKHASYNQQGVYLLKQYLLKYYPVTHEIIFYEAAQYPGIQPNIIKLLLHELDQVALSSISTMYIAPVSCSAYDVEMAIALGLLSN